MTLEPGMRNTEPLRIATCSHPSCGIALLSSLASGSLFLGEDLLFHKLVRPRHISDLATGKPVNPSGT